MKYLVFDMDGTLVQLPVDWDIVHKELRSHIRGEWETVLGLYSRYCGTPTYDLADKIVEKYEQVALEDLEILDDSPSIIEELSKKYKIILVTMQPKSIAGKIIDMLYLGNYVEEFYTRNDACTRIEQIKLVAEKHGRENIVLFTGDKILDAIAGYVNGIETAIVLRGKIHRFFTETDDIIEDLEALGIHIFYSLKQVRDYLRKMRLINTN